MRRLAPGNPATVAFALALLLRLLPCLGDIPTISACREDVDVQIVPDKRVYTAGETARVEFLVRNGGDTPLFLFKSINQCSSPLGWLSLRVRSPHDTKFPGLECAVDYDMNKVHPAQELSDSKYGIVLRKDEVFGKRQEYKLPKEKGVYRLQGEIGQVGFLTDDQENELTEHRMRILRHTCLSPVVTIEVK